MGNVTLRYGSTGYSKVRGELSGLEKASGRLEGAFGKVGVSADKTTPRITNFFTKFGGAMKGAAGIAGRFLTIATKVVSVITAIGAAAAGVAAAGFMKWGHSMLKVTESFRLLEISLYGVLKSWDKVKVVSEFAKEYAAKYPAMYGDIMRAMSSMAMMPALKPIFMKGDIKGMTDIMTIVQSMATMRPDQGITGALFALREALGGNWRTLAMRFDVPVRSVAETVGMTMEEMRASPMAALKALKGWTDATVGADTLAMAAKNLGTQLGNIKDKYEMWLERLGKLGIYQKVVDYIIKMNDFMDQLMESDKIEEWTRKLNSALEGIAERLAGIFTEGIDWGGIESLGGLIDAFRQIGKNALEAMRNVWDANKDILRKGLEAVMSKVAEGVAFTVKEIFIPVGAAIGKGIFTGVKQFFAEHPILGAAGGAAVGAKMGAAFGPWGALIGAGAGAGAAGVLAGRGRVEKGIAQRQTELWGPGGFERYMERASTEAGFKKIYKEMVDASRKAIKEGAIDWSKVFQGGLDIEQLVTKGAVTHPLGGPLEEYRMWAGMAGRLAQAPRGPARPSAAMAFGMGAIGFEQFQAQRRVERFQEKQTSKLTEIAEAPTATQAVKAGAFQELFGIALERGQIGKAETYMEKAIDAWTGASEKQEAMAKLEAEKTTKMVEFQEKIAKAPEILQKMLEKMSKEREAVSPEKTTYVEEPETVE